MSSCVRNQLVTEFDHHVDRHVDQWETLAIRDLVSKVFALPIMGCS